MAPRRTKKDKQRELAATYSRSGVNNVAGSLKKQGYSSKSGVVSYTVGGVKYDAATGRPIKAKEQSKPDKPVQSAVQSRQSSGGGGSSRPMPAAVTSGSSSSSSRSTPPASRPASDAGMKNQDKSYRGNLFEKTFGYKKGEAPDQVAARDKLIKDGKASRAEYNVSEEEGKRRLSGGQSSEDRTKTAFSSSTLSNKTVPSAPDYSGSKTTNNTSQAFSSKSLNSAAESLAEKIRKRRQG